MDLIDRQAAIEEINHICPVDTEYDCTLLDRVDVRCVLSDLPSAQPKTTCIKMILSEEQMQEVVERVKNEFCRESQDWLTHKLKEKENDPTYTGKRFEGYKEAILAVKSKLHELYTEGEDL